MSLVPCYLDYSYKSPKNPFWMSHEPHEHIQWNQLEKSGHTDILPLYVASWHEVGFLIHWTNVIWFTDGDGERNFLLCQKNELAIASYPFPVHSATCIQRRQFTSTISGHFQTFEIVSKQFVFRILFKFLITFELISK